MWLLNYVFSMEQAYVHFTEAHVGFQALTVHVVLSLLLFGGDAHVHIFACLCAFIYLGVLCRGKSKETLFFKDLHI